MNSRNSIKSNFSLPFADPSGISMGGGIGSMYLKIFQLYLDMFARDKAIIYGEKAMHHYEMIGDKETLAYILERMGDLYDFFDRFEQSLSCYSRCEEIKKAKNSFTELI